MGLLSTFDGFRDLFGDDITNICIYSSIGFGVFVFILIVTFLCPWRMMWCCFSKKNTSVDTVKVDTTVDPKIKLKIVQSQKNKPSIVYQSPPTMAFMCPPSEMVSCVPPYQAMPMQMAAPYRMYPMGSQMGGAHTVFHGSGVPMTGRQNPQGNLGHPNTHEQQINPMIVHHMQMLQMQNNMLLNQHAAMQQAQRNKVQKSLISRTLSFFKRKFNSSPDVNGIIHGIPNNQLPQEQMSGVLSNNQMSQQTMPIQTGQAQYPRILHGHCQLNGQNQKSPANKSGEVPMNSPKETSPQPCTTSQTQNSKQGKSN